MAFVAKSFIGPAKALDNEDSTGLDHRGNDGLAKQVEDYLTGSDSGTIAGSAGAREIKITCAALSGDRVFVLVSAENTD